MSYSLVIKMCSIFIKHELDFPCMCVVLIVKVILIINYESYSVT